MTAIKHGHDIGHHKSKEYGAWDSMKQRCYNPNAISYKNYGARGIMVCERWLNSFINFLSDMGISPSKKHSLDRIKVNEDYSPANCKWSTYREQQRNRRDSIFLTHNGETKSLPDWCDLYSLNREFVNSRLRRGWTDEEALAIPKMSKYESLQRKGRPVSNF